MKNKIKIIVTIFVILGLLKIALLGCFLYGVAKEVAKEFQKNGQGKIITSKWHEYNDSHGFAVEKPILWQAVVDKTGFVKIGPDPTNNKGPVAFVRTIVLLEPLSAEEVLEALEPDLKKLFPDFEIVSKRNLEKYNSLVGRIKYSGSEHIGAFLISVDNKNAFISGIAAEEEKFNETRADLLRVLASFRYNENLKEPAKITGVISMVPWQDPSEGAFTVNVPSGWNVSGGIVRPYADAAVKMDLVSQEKGIQIESPCPPFYVVPTWVLEMSGFSEGSSYNPSGGVFKEMIVRKEMSAKEYIQNILADRLGLSVKEAKARPDIVSKAVKLPWTTQTTAAEATLEGDGKVHKVIVTEQGMNVGGMGMWTVSLIHYWAPESEIPLVEEIVGKMGDSFQINQAWAAREQAEVAKRTGIISQTGSEIAEIISSSFEYSSEVHERAGRQWSDAMLGVERVYNPGTGETFEVPYGSEHYWTDAYNIVGTKVSEPPTYHDDWAELLPVE